MSRRHKFVAGGLVIVAAIAWLIWAGVSQSVVYFVTPSELLAAPVASKTYRLGGLVMPGSRCGGGAIASPARASPRVVTDSRSKSYR